MSYLSPDRMSPVQNEVLKAAEGDEYTIDKAVEEEKDEKLVVFEGYTIVDPRTVMIHLEDTSSTHRAMVSSVWLDHSTFLTISHGSLYCPHSYRKILVNNYLLQQSLLSLITLTAFYTVQLI